MRRVATSYRPPTTFSRAQNADGTYTVSIDPQGEDINGIPSGEDFYVLLRTYVPVNGADLNVSAVKVSQ